MAYSRTTWVDGTTPAINATNLNNIEDGIARVSVSSTTDNTLPRFHSTNGTLQTSGVVVDDNNNVTGIVALTTTGNIQANKTTGPAKIQVKSTYTGAETYLTMDGDGGGAYFDMKKAGVNRWSIFTTNGDELRVRHYDNAGANPVDDININRSSGKITLGTVTSAAGLELGSSGPREMVGTGSPESSVTAPAGSVWRQTDDATFSYLKWYKATGTGNTGWLVDYEGRWKDFTPTLKDSGGTTLSGWTCTGRYTVRGKWCQVIIDITASTPSAGTGEYRLYLPTDAQAATSSPVRWCAEGSLVAYDNSSGNLGWFRVSMTNAAYVTAWTPQTWPYSNGQHQLSATIPNFTWAASDKINGSFSYEIA